MKNLFIINPVVANIKGRVSEVVEEIKSLFQNYPQIDYHIHITRWSRDAVGYTRKYVLTSKELVRVYAIGGTGTLFEVINGVIGLPNVQIAHYPLGRSNGLVRYFGKDKFHLFLSLRNLMFGNVIAIDAIRGGNNYGVSYGTVGFEAIADRDGTEMIEKTNLPPDFCYIGACILNLFKNKQLSQYYKINLDGNYLDADYLSIMLANTPYYGQDLHPAVEAHPNDGILDIYCINNISKLNIIRMIPTYTGGNYQKIPDYVSHYTGKHFSVSSDTVMSICLDGEIFYDNSFEYEIIPGAIDFVCPGGIDIRKVPHIFS